jgi:hypothetical protein
LVVAVAQQFAAGIGQRVEVRQFMPDFDLLPLYASQIDKSKDPTTPGGPK